MFQNEDLQEAAVVFAFDIAVYVTLIGTANQMACA